MADMRSFPKKRIQKLRHIKKKKKKKRKKETRILSNMILKERRDINVKMFHKKGF